MTDGAFKRLRVAVIGSCQVVGLAAATQRLLPGADVKAWHVGVHPKDSDEDLLALLPGFDTVISQISDRDGQIPLRISRLREQGLPVVYLPVVAFPGFHPDITYIRGPDGLVHGLATDYHSVIVASAFTLGLPERRVPELFNAYTFAELGYFDVFQAAKAALLSIFDQDGFDVRPLFDLWMQQAGQFMYTINHPHILVLATLCRLALARAGHLEPTAPLPEGINDHLAMHFIWPTYPTLAKRIGLPGSTTFLRNTNGLAEGEAREMALADYVSACFRIYGGLAKDTLRIGAVATACERLGALVVA
jgi:Polysaccharide biosynthesis enzyme WcbI